MRKLFVFILCLLFVSCSQNIHDGNNCNEDWYYPVVPGMEEWKNFQTNNEKIAACQIPENILFCLSAEKLTDLVLQYPLFGNINAFNKLDDGIEQLFIDFNGIRELFKRKDAASYLTKRYAEKIQSLSFLEDESIDFYERFLFMMSINNLSVLFSRVEQQESLKEILRNLVMGYESISMSDNDYKFHMLEYNFYSRAHVIIKMCEQCLEKIPYGKHNSVFYPSGPVWDPAYDIINELSYQLIN